PPIPASRSSRGATRGSITGGSTTGPGASPVAPGTACAERGPAASPVSLGMACGEGGPAASPVGPGMACGEGSPAASPGGPGLAGGAGGEASPDTPTGSGLRGAAYSDPNGSTCCCTTDCGRRTGRAAFGRPETYAALNRTSEVVLVRRKPLPGEAGSS